MTISETHLIYFSPTLTSKQVGEAIVRGMDMNNIILTNITLQPVEHLVISDSALAVIVVPVYGGHVAPLAMERLHAIRGTNTPVVLVAVYGNRAYENALDELESFATLHGFKVIAGATFIGEHSFSSEKNPIAAGRPDLHDLDLARDFGRQIRGKIEPTSSTTALKQVNLRLIRRPKQAKLSLLSFLFNAVKLKKSKKPMPVIPTVDREKCTHCGLCVMNCPAMAIKKGEEWSTEASRCIRCCACVKVCKNQARAFNTPFAVLLSRYFRKQKEPQTIL